MIALWWFDEAKTAGSVNGGLAQSETSNDGEPRSSGMNAFVWAMIAAGVLVIAVIGVRSRRVRK